MLYNIRDVINTNRLYTWMVIFIMLVQAYAISLKLNGPPRPKGDLLTAEEFKLRLETKRQELQKLLQKDPQLAVALGYAFLFILVSFITGCVFLVDYFIKKVRDNTDIIPRTLDAPFPLWGIADVFKIVILFIFFHHLFSLCANILIGPSLSRVLDRRTNMVITTALMDFLACLFVFRFVGDKYRQSVTALGISGKGLLRNIGVAIYSYLSFLPILALIFIGVVAAAKVLNYTPPPGPVYELIFEENRPALLVAVSVLASVIGPIIEEIFFRGFLYAALKKKVAAPWAIFLSAFLFSLLHTNILGFIPILALGIFLAYLREKTGSLMPAISVHIMHNTALTSLMFLMRDLLSKV